MSSFFFEDSLFKVLIYHVLYALQLKRAEKKKKKAPTFPSLTILKQLSTIYFRSRVFSLSNER